MLLKIEILITKGSGSLSQRHAMASLYVLYHSLVKPNPDLEEIKVDHQVFARCDELLQTASIESLATRLLIDDDFEWPRDECAAVVSAYSQEKFSRESISLPLETEAALFAEIGNMFLATPPDIELARAWFRKARLELVGHPEKQLYLKACAAASARVDRRRLLRVWIPDEPAQTTGEPK